MAEAIQAQNPPARKICSVEGCDSPMDGRGFCKLHYARWKRHGDPLAGRTQEGAPHAFLAQAKEYTGDDCLIWPFATIKGYACIRIDGVSQYVSRIVCELAHGPAPLGADHALHGCGRGDEGCVAQRHLRWGTPTDNAEDMVRHGRSNLGHAFGPPSPEAIAKKSAALKGHPVSKETREKIGQKARLRHATKSSMGSEP